MGLCGNLAILAKLSSVNPLECMYWDVCEDHYQSVWSSVVFCWCQRSQTERLWKITSTADSDWQLKSGCCQKPQAISCIYQSIGQDGKRRDVLEPRFSGNKTRWLTIHSIDPDGCSKFWFPLHRDFMVASPKSPTLTVRSSWRKMSDTESRTMNTSPERSPYKPSKGYSHDRPGKTKMAVSFLSVAMNALHSAN